MSYAYADRRCIGKMFDGFLWQPTGPEAHLRQVPYRSSRERWNNRSVSLRGMDCNYGVTLGALRYTSKSSADFPGSIQPTKQFPFRKCCIAPSCDTRSSATSSVCSRPCSCSSW